MKLTSYPSCMFVLNLKIKVMKTMKRFITVIAVLLTVGAYAASDIHIRTNGNTEVIIQADNNTGDESIRIFDEKGTLLFFERINKDQYLKTFTLATLPNGKYFVEYENESKINTAIIVKSEDETLVTSNFKQVSFKPLFKQEGNYVSVGITNPHLKDVSISIEDSKGFELTEIKNLKDVFVRKTFDTQRLPKGDYTVLVKCGDKSHSKLISIK